MPTTTHRDVPGARIVLTPEGQRFRAMLYPPKDDGPRAKISPAGRPVLGTYATADEAYDAALALLAAGDDRLCSVRDIERARREVCAPGDGAKG